MTLPAVAAGCGDEPSTVQLVLRAETGVAEQLIEVEVLVTAVITTGGGNVIPCRPCVRLFHPHAGAVMFPIIIDFVRGSTQYEKAWFIVTYRTAGWSGTLYHSIEFPDSGLRSNTRLIQSSCLGQACPSGEHCLDSSCYPVAGLEGEVLRAEWSGRSCSDDCGNPPEAGGDADADADAETDSEAGTDDSDVVDGTPPEDGD